MAVAITQQYSGNRNVSAPLDYASTMRMFFVRFYLYFPSLPSVVFPLDIHPVLFTNRLQKKDICRILTCEFCKACSSKSDDKIKSIVYFLLSTSVQQIIHQMSGLSCVSVGNTGIYQLSALIWTDTAGLYFSSQPPVKESKDRQRLTDQETSSDTQRLKQLFISLLKSFKACLSFSHPSRLPAEFSCCDLRGMWVALGWYSLFEQAGMYKPAPSIAAIMGTRPGVTTSINTAKEIMIFIMMDHLWL